MHTMKVVRRNVDQVCLFQFVLLGKNAKNNCANLLECELLESVQITSEDELKAKGTEL